MKRPAHSRVAEVVLVLAASLALAAQAWAQSGPLPSRNDGAAKKAIVEFVRATTAQGGPQFVPPTERIAAFDHDGYSGCGNVPTRMAGRPCAGP